MDGTHRVYNEDCVSGMQKHVRTGSIDLIFVDPPYGIAGDELDSHYHREESFVVPGYVDVPQSQYAEFSRQWIGECSRTLRPGGSIYIVSGYTNLHHVLNSLHATDLTEVNHIVARYSFGVSTKHKWVSSHYHVLYWSKPEGRRTFNSMWKYTDHKDSYRDRLTVQEMSRSHKPGQLKNRNQLNEAFIEKFVRYSSNRGDTVLDPFCGGFTTGRTALRCGRKFVGFELNPLAFAAFATTLDDVAELHDPPQIVPDALELEKRNRMRAAWSAKRQERKRLRKSQE